MATTETRRRRGYKLVPMRQWSQWIDIVERLRVRPLLANDDPDIAEWRKRMEEAGDEIEQLRDEITFLKKGNVGVCEAIDDASEEEITAEIQQLLNAGVLASFGAPSMLNTDMFQQEGEATGLAPSPALESLHPAVGTNSSAIKSGRSPGARRSTPSDLPSGTAPTRSIKNPGRRYKAAKRSSKGGKNLSRQVQIMRLWLGRGASAWGNSI